MPYHFGALMPRSKPEINLSLLRCRFRALFAASKAKTASPSEGLQSSTRP